MSRLIEHSFEDTQIISESKDGQKFWYVEGIFAQANKVNRNRRVYPKEVLKESMDAYVENYVSKNRAIGELSHPANTTLNPDRASHLILSLEESGDDYIGRARVLNTPCGKIVQGLLEGGVNIGVSTRAEGKVRKNTQGIDEVESGLRMTTIDVVLNPSGPDCWVDSLMESEVEWDVSDPDSVLIMGLKEDIKLATARGLQEAKLEAFRKFLNYIKG